MDPRALRDLRLDVRLHGRHGWISRSELATALDELPDVSNKTQGQESTQAGDPQPGGLDADPES